MNDTERTVRDSWGRIAAWLREHGQTGPVRTAARAEQLAALEAELGVSLPADLRVWWLLDDMVRTPWIPWGFVPVGLGTAMMEHVPGFLPVARSADGDLLLVDLRPGPAHGSVHAGPPESAPLWGSVTALLADAAESLTEAGPLPVRDAVDPGVGAFATPSAERPPTPVPVDWEAVEEWLGLRLPGDYRRLADAYGPLDVGEFLWVHVPCAEGEFDYGEWLREAHAQARRHLLALPDEERRAVHPERGGLLAWGTTRGGDTLFWDTSVSSDPDAWTVVVQHADTRPGSGLRPWQRYDLTLTGYLRYAVRDSWELPDPPGQLLHLPGTLARTAFLSAATPWTPPPPVEPRLTEDERRIALETGTGLDALRLLTPPPEQPYLGDGTWQGLFRALGSRLPREYVRLMTAYGAGTWSGWLRFPAPLRTTAPRLLTYVEETLEAYEQLKESSPEWYPLSPWPAPDGFLPFADSIDGDHLGWLATGEDPDTWPVLFWPRHADQGPPLTSGLLDTLLSWQRGTFTTTGLPHVNEPDDPMDSAHFTPWNGR